MSAQDVYFKIGLIDHPDTATRLKALADAVRGTMADIDAASRNAQHSLAGIGIAAAEARTKASAGAARFSIPAPQPLAPAGAHALPGVAASTQTYQSQLIRLAGVTPENVAGTGPNTPAAAFPPVAAAPPVSPPMSEPAGIPPAAVEKKAKDDARRYTTTFSETIGQLAGLEGDDLKLLVGGDKERFSVLGKEDGKAYRDSLRKQLTSDLGLSGDMAGELFGAQGGAGLKKQQDEHAAAQKQKSEAYKAESERLNQSLTSNIEAYGKLDAAGQVTSLSLGKNFRELAEKSEGFASGIGQAASGLAFLGAKNENIKSLVNTLLTIKGVSDIGIGVVKSISGVVQVVSLLKERQQLSNKQTEIAAEKSRLARAAAADYVELLQREGIALEKAVQGNKQHAELLQRVAQEARQAAAAQRELNAAEGDNIPGGNVGGGVGHQSGRPGGAGRAGTGAGRAGRMGRFGRGVGRFLMGAGTIATGQAINSVGGGGLVSQLGEYAFESLAGRMIGGAGGGAALGGGVAAGGSAAGGAAAASGGAAGAGAAGAGAAGAGAAAGIGGLAAAGAAAAAALGAVALVGVELKEVFEGTANKVGSVTDTIGSWEAKAADWVGDMTGLFDIIGNSENGAKADKALKKRKEQEEENRIKNEGSSEHLRLQREAGAKTEDRKRADMSTIAGISSEVGKSSLSGLMAHQANLQRELAGESQFGSLFQGGGSADKRQRAESLERRRRLQLELSNVGSTISGIQQTAGVVPGQELAGRKLSLQKDLKKEMEDIARLEKDGADSSTNYVSALQRADQLSQQLVQVEREQLELVRSQKDERMKANEVAIDGANKRIDMLKREREAAQQTLKSGAERFASMSSADQAAAKRAMALANAGGSERLSDRQRSLLRSIGTSSAVEAAEKADAAEARKKGFFQSFGKEEQSRIAAAGREEQQLKVEIANTQAINVKIDLDYKRMAADVVNTVKPIIARAQNTFQKEVDTQFQRNATANMVRTNQELEKQRNLKKST